MRPTRAPPSANATARFVAIVDFPTPPFPLEIATTCPRFGKWTGCCGGCGFGAGRSSMTGSELSFFAIPRNLQDASRLCEDLVAHVVERARDECARRACVTAAAESPRERIYIHATGAPERRFHLSVSEIPEEDRHARPRD